MTPRSSGPVSGAVLRRASATIESASASTHRALATICPPTGVTWSVLLVRSKSATPSDSSSFLSCVLRVGWLTWQASAARPKWPRSARATR